jgi:hypothetical protein
VWASQRERESERERERARESERERERARARARERENEVMHGANPKRRWVSSGFDLIVMSKKCSPVIFLNPDAEASKDRQIAETEKIWWILVIFCAFKDKTLFFLPFDLKSNNSKSRCLFSHRKQLIFLPTFHEKVYFLTN